MNQTFTKYTFTFDNEDVDRFRNIMSRLDSDEFIIVEDIHKIIPTKENQRQTEMQTVIEMEPEAASTFRFGLKKLTIKRYRTEEEEIEKKAIEDQNRITITVKVDGLKI